MFRIRKKIPVFHENNLEQILKRFKLWKKFENNELKDAICGCVITRENFGCIFLTKDGTVKVACSNPECLEKVYEDI
jgi:hypothetical protein